MSWWEVAIIALIVCWNVFAIPAGLGTLMLLEWREDRRRRARLKAEGWL